MKKNKNREQIRIAVESVRGVPDVYGENDLKERKVLRLK